MNLSEFKINDSSYRSLKIRPLMSLNNSEIIKNSNEKITPFRNGRNNNRNNAISNLLNVSGNIPKRNFSSRNQFPQVRSLSTNSPNRKDIF